MSVDPTGETIRRFRGEDDGGPVIMLNLLRFAGAEGRASYERYSGKVLPFLEAVGGLVLYAGECSTILAAPDEHRWDAIFVVRYPSRAAFLNMVANPDYQAVTHLRTDGLEAAVLQATTPWGAQS